jgi:hypothetical protein
LEKICLLHEEFQKPFDKMRVQKLSRHLYDIEKLSNTPFAEKALQDIELYKTIVAHRQKFTPIVGIDYQNHTWEKINFIPPKEVIKDWQKDYELMAQTMLYGEVLAFEELITRLTELKRRINQQTSF